MTLRQIVNLITITLALLLLAPTALILASWNSLPDDSLYATKRTLEKVALALLSPSYQTQTSLQTKLITRRLNEATATIDQKSSSRGLAELKSQLQTAQTQVAQAPNQEAKTAAAQKLVTALTQTQAQLETKKQVITQTIVRETVRTVYVTPSPTTPPSPTPILTTTSDAIVTDIEDIQEQIDAIITGLGQSENRGRSEDRHQDKDNESRDREKMNRSEKEEPDR